jgi:tRNA pseudouridine38-40 synthase
MVRRVRAIRFVSGGDELTIRISADSFCHQMVRSIVGTLLEIGKGRIGAEHVSRILRMKDRAAARPLVSGRGLHLVEVLYRSSPFKRVDGIKRSP